MEFFEMVIRRNGQKETKVKSTDISDLSVGWDSFCQKNGLVKNTKGRLKK